MADNVENTGYTRPANRTMARASVKTASGINVLAGIWLIISPFVLGFWRLPAATWDNIIVGIVILILAATRVAQPTFRTAWASWVNLILGIWLIISPWVLQIAGAPVPLWNNVVLGIVVGVLGLISGASTTDTRRVYTTPPV